MSDSLDRRFMMAAIRLGASGNGTTWPNPSVGAIVVKDGRVVGRGRTAKGGRPHAEPIALAAAGDDAQGSALYVSLEPCSHHGRTPPCADAIVAAKVGRVVSALVDPNPEVAAKGLKRLEEGGVDVASGVMEAEARRAHAGHIRRIESGRPHVTLKLAVSADDAIGRTGETQVAVTGEIARRHVQALRSRFDAIMVGRGTVEVDDPALTVRIPGLEDRSPVRIVLDSDARLGGDRRVFDAAAPTWLIAADGSTAAESMTSPSRGGRNPTSGASGISGGGLQDQPPSRSSPSALRPANFDLPSRGRLGGSSTELSAEQPRRLFAPRGVGGLDLGAALKRLAEEGITRLLVEGGAHVARALIEADRVDEVMLFRSPLALGGALVPALAGLPLTAIEASDRFRRVERRRFGADMMSRYERAG